MQSSAKTVVKYLKSLPDDRREVISYLRGEIVKVLPEGYEEVMNWGMISYQVPLSIYPDTYNKQPLMFVALASQKNHIAIYLMATYALPDKDDWLKKQFENAGKKLDMGKSCIRFKKLDDITLQPILEIIQKTDIGAYVERFRSLRATKK